MVRVVKDTFGELEVAEGKYWGAQTERSLKNFPIGEETMPKGLIEAFVMLKRSAARSNLTLGALSKEKADAIVTACDQWLHAPDYQHFPLSVWQTGSGTQTNMNVNEVLSFIGSSDQLSLHPNDDVNRSQSSNDTFPTAMHVATVLAIEEKLTPALKRIKQTLKAKEIEFDGVVKIGRTHLQDATPLKVSQEISGWCAMIEKIEALLKEDVAQLMELAIGGTAVGTGLNAPDGFGETVARELSHYTGQPFKVTDNHFHGLTSHDQLVRFHGTLKALAANMMKIGNDIRFLASGPRAGYGEYTIPANEPGSSIMPGKVNPTQIEALTMVAVQVMGNDTAVGMAASQGHFQLNVFKPVIIYNVMQSIDLLSDAIDSFTIRALSGLAINEAVMQDNVDQSLMLVTALTPAIGYEEAAAVAKQAFQEGKTLKAVVIERGLLDEMTCDGLLDPKKMVE
ncbi:fumarase class II [Streptohalobacillus salinus]|uniref:Fumarate hydratase class II n=1 Tax=Streptohalobacillus salinus TaxID=621096 RepID=A0A2V3WHP2_9BACI|nr:class II fumarate hydratase [Streptohalobacillus salinus]PXW93061.1 fumarase class II [Streptohalobacillus salinus]